MNCEGLKGLCHLLLGTARRPENISFSCGMEQVAGADF